MKEKKEILKREQTKLHNYSFVPNIDQKTKNIILNSDYSPIQNRVYNIINKFYEVIKEKKANLKRIELDNLSVDSRNFTPEINKDYVSKYPSNDKKTVYERLYSASKVL